MAARPLAQRKLELDRSYRNLGHFLKTLDALHRRGDRSGQVMFSEFADFYVAKHVSRCSSRSGRAATRKWRCST